MTVYVYKQYYDDYAYGEEAIRVFANKEDAMKALREDVEKAYQLPWNDIPEAHGFDDRDTFEPDYVSVFDGEASSFWIIEEHIVEGVKDE